MGRIRYVLPKVDFLMLSDFNDLETIILESIVKKDGTVKSTKPKTLKGYRKEISFKEEEILGMVQMVWRLVVFSVSPKREHQCMPVMAEFYLSEDIFKDKDFKDYLYNLSDKIVNTIPKSQWYGVTRWAKAMGQI